MDLYFRKLKRTGVLMIHIAGKDDTGLEKMLATIAGKLGLSAYSYRQDCVIGKHVGTMPYKAFQKLEKLLKMRLTHFFKQPYESSYSWAVFSNKELDTPELYSTSDIHHAPRWAKLSLETNHAAYTDEEVNYKPESVA